MEGSTGEEARMTSTPPPAADKGSEAEGDSTAILSRNAMGLPPIGAPAPAAAGAAADQAGLRLGDPEPPAGGPADPEVRGLREVRDRSGRRPAPHARVLRAELLLHPREGPDGPQGLGRGRDGRPERRGRAR